MPRNKKMTKEERDRELALQVEELQKKYKAEQEYKSKFSFIKKTIDLITYMYAYEHLRPKYIFETAKNLIDNSDLSDSDKDLLARNFAEGFLFSGGQGFKEEDWPAVQKCIVDIKNKLRGQT